MQKKYVSVSAEVDTDGVIRPLLIRWHDGRQWEVTKVLHTCTASHDEFEGVRYTIKIGFMEIYNKSLKKDEPESVEANVEEDKEKRELSETETVSEES